jgi:RNA polymerase sigma-70 factor (ECF subfamily)
MARYAAGDGDAFAAVYDAVRPRLYAYLLRCTGDVNTTADLLQQTFLHVHRARGQFTPGADVFPWVLGIARHLVIDLARTPNRQLVLTSETTLAERPGREAAADELVHARELAARLAVHVKRLPAQQRRAFQLIKMQNVSMSEAAAILKISVGAVKQRLYRAQETLRSLVTEFGRIESQFEQGVTR